MDHARVDTPRCGVALFALCWGMGDGARAPRVCSPEHKVDSCEDRWKFLPRPPSNSVSMCDYVRAHKVTLFNVEMSKRRSLLKIGNLDERSNFSVHIGHPRATRTIYTMRSCAPVIQSSMCDYVRARKVTLSMLAGSHNHTYWTELLGHITSVFVLCTLRTRTE